MRFTLDPSVRRRAEGRVAVGGSPLTFVRLSPNGAARLEQAARGDDVPAGALGRLVELGFLHPRPAAGEGPFAVGDVTVVVPARDPEPGALEAIVTASAHAGVLAIVVVDDASARSIGPIAGARVVRRSEQGGPGAARNTGLAEVATALVAFVDADVTLAPGWLEGLLGHFGDDAMALVAPRVASSAGDGAGTGVLGRYESARSPLDLGPLPARVQAGTRVSYVPTAAVVARVDAVRAVGGFDEAMTTGEDVDLVWRLVEAGRRVRYEPEVVVLHAPRSSLRRWIDQRRGYGRSAAPLARRHPGALAPVRVSGWSAAVWGLVAGGHPVGAVAVGVGTTGALATKLPEFEGRWGEVARLAGLGHLHAGRLLASAVTRTWWPIALVGAVASRRVRRGVLVAAVVPVAWEWLSERPPLDPVRYGVLRLLDDAAYGVGVWEGCVRERTFEPLRPDLTSWPRPSRYERTRPGRPGGR
jgi:mycofactocin system glycosyltransferase